jgi:capsular polysaccharide biosynthesis protein
VCQKDGLIIAVTSVFFVSFFSRRVERDFSEMLQLPWLAKIASFRGTPLPPALWNH